MAKRKGSPVSRESASSKREREGMDESEGMVDHDAREVENAKRLDKLPQEVWEKITDNLENDDLFPLALSCRYFRQKQKELVARARQNVAESGKPRLALKTDLGLVRMMRVMAFGGQPASAAYLRFCSEEKVPGIYRPHFEACLGRSCARGRDIYVSCLAAFHGLLPLLQKLQAGSETLPLQIVQSAGESSSSTISSFLFPLLTSSPLSPFHSARRPAGDLEVAENPEGVQARLGAFRHSLQRRPFRDFEVAQE